MEIALLIIFVVALIAGAFFINQWRLKRALRKVVQILRKHNATTTETAKLVSDVGLQHRGLFSMKGTRDVKPDALDFLIRQEIVVVTSDGKIYLSESKLANSPLKTSLNIPSTL